MGPARPPPAANLPVAIHLNSEVPGHTRGNGIALAGTRLPDLDSMADGAGEGRDGREGVLVEELVCGCHRCSGLWAA